MGKIANYLPSCHSTNDIASDKVRSSRFVPGEVVITDRQTAGKGQRGNQWLTADGLNFTLSVILSPSFLPVASQFLLSQCVALGIHRYLSLYTGGVWIKWPNDVLIGHRKVAGVLIENMVRGQRIYASVIGIGLNMNQLAFDSPRAVSLSEAAGRSFDLPAELESLLLSLEHYYSILEQGNAEMIRSAYRSALYGIGERRVFYRERMAFDAVVAGVTAEGRLLLVTDGVTQDFGMQELTWSWPD